MNDQQCKGFYAGSDRYIFDAAFYVYEKEVSMAYWVKWGYRDKGIIALIKFLNEITPIKSLRLHYEEGKCKAVQGAFTFIGWGTVIAGTAIILGGDSNKLEALPENLASFQMMTEWVEPADVPPATSFVTSF